MRAASECWVAFAFALGAAVYGQPVAAQNTSEVLIERYSCRELLRESGADRDVAVAFMHGYILGKAGTTTLAIDSMRTLTNAFIERCLDDPKQSAFETMIRSSGGEQRSAPAAARP